jgi:hypothetical protein
MGKTRSVAGGLSGDIPWYEDVTEELIAGEFGRDCNVLCSLWLGGIEEDTPALSEWRGSFSGTSQGSLVTRGMETTFLSLLFSPRCI